MELPVGVQQLCREVIEAFLNPANHLPIAKSYRDGSVSGGDVLTGLQQFLPQILERSLTSVAGLGWPDSLAFAAG